jgi:putative heme-binding domain-containing protein
VFRRAELNCVGCHAIGGAGGAIGPELSAIGQGNPVDYLVNSVLVPDQIIKEQYQTLVVLTVDGQVFQGIVADRDDTKVVLREATGELRTVPTADIEDQ